MREKLFIAVVVLFCSIFNSGAQNPKFLPYEITPEGDTLFFDNIKPAHIWQKMPKQKGKYWREYYRLVYNFSKVYPYSKAAKYIVEKTDSTIACSNFSRRKKEQYIKEVQSELMNAYETPLKNLSITQGQLLMKLIDREIGRSSYTIIKDYIGGISAGFWQGVAKIFGSNLKKRYDPEGDDAQVEELIKIWESGGFEELYWSIFWEYPKIPVVESYTK